MPWEPLPEGQGANPLIQRLKAVNAEIYGTLFANAGIIGGDVTIEGTLVGNDIRSSNWNGAIPANLTSIDATATAGYYFDGSLGSAQFEGDLFVDGELGVYGDLFLNTGGTFRTTPLAGLTDAGIAMYHSAGNVIEFYSGDANELKAGTILELVSGSGSTRTLQFGIYSPALVATERQVAIIVSSASADGSTYKPSVAISKVGSASGLQPIFQVNNEIPSYLSGDTQIGTSTTDADLTLYGWIRTEDGSVSAPAHSFVNETDTGAYSAGTNQYAIAVNGTQELLLGSTGFKVQNVYNSTDPTAANVFVNTDGGLYRSTSSIRYKNNVRDASWLALLDLRPRQYTSKTKAGTYYGLIAEEVAEELPEAAIFSADGQDIEDYDTRAVIAVLVAKVNRLEERLREHGVDIYGP